MRKAAVFATVALLVLTGCGKSEPQTEASAQIVETTPTQISAQQVENFKVQAETGAKCVGYFESSHSYAKDKGDSEGENRFNELSVGAINLGRTDAAMASISADDFDKMAFKYADKFDEIIDRSKKNEATDVDLAFVKQAKSECIKYMNAENIQTVSSKEDIATPAPATSDDFSNVLLSYHDSMLGADKVVLTWNKVRNLCKIPSGTTESNFSYTESACYKKVKSVASSECYAMIDAAKSDCAKAGDPNYCMKNLHKTEWLLDAVSSCMSMSAE